MMALGVMVLQVVQAVAVRQIQVMAEQEMLGDIVQ
jgi:hypothetical protein